MFGDSAISFVQSEDGRFLYFPNQDSGLSIARGDLKAGELKTVFCDPKDAALNGFKLRGDTLYVRVLQSRDSDAADVLAIHLTSGSAQIVQHIDHVPGDFEAGFAISPDGKSLLISEMEQDHSDIYLMPYAAE